MWLKKEANNPGPPINCESTKPKRKYIGLEPVLTNKHSNPNGIGSNTTDFTELWNKFDKLRAEFRGE